MSYIAGINTLKAFDEERANGQMQTVDGVANVSAHISLPGCMNNQQLAHKQLFDTLFQLD